VRYYVGAVLHDDLVGVTSHRSSYHYIAAAITDSSSRCPSSADGGFPSLTGVIAGRAAGRQF